MPKAQGGRASGDGGVQSVRHALSILDHLAQHRRPVGVTEVAKALGVTKSRIFRHFRTLLELGYIVQSDDSNKYRIGSKLITTGLVAVSNLDLVTAARDVVRGLRDKLGHTVVVSQIEEEGLRILYVQPGKSTYSLKASPGRMLRFDHSAQGKVALAFGRPSLWESLAHEWARDGGPTAGARISALSTELDRVRRQGWAVEEAEYSGVNIVAAPIYDRRRGAIGTIAMIDFSEFLPDKPRPEQVGAILAAASRISGAIGNEGEGPAGW